MTNLTNREAIEMLTAKVECFRRDVNGIDAGCNHSYCGECGLYYKQGTIGDQMEALCVVISALQAQELNETQNALDTISRQAAINAVKRLSLGETDATRLAMRIEDYLKRLPSAQPENIRCYECKHGTHSGRGNIYICHVSPELVMEHIDDFYCGYAKRKTDGEVD